MFYPVCTIIDSNPSFESPTIYYSQETRTIQTVQSILYNLLVALSSIFNEKLTTVSNMKLKINELKELISKSIKIFPFYINHRWCCQFYDQEMSWTRWEMSYSLPLFLLHFSNLEETQKTKPCRQLRRSFFLQLHLQVNDNHK